MIKLKNNLKVRPNLKVTSKITSFFKEKKEIASVYLFGSFASGKFTKTSDIDIGVLFENKFLQFADDLKEQYMTQLGRILRKDVEILVMNRAGEVILNQIYKKGKPIVIKNKKYANEFKIKSIALYTDFEFYLKQMQNAFAQNLMDN